MFSDNPRVDHFVLDFRVFEDVPEILTDLLDLCSRALHCRTEFSLCLYARAYVLTEKLVSSDYTERGPPGEFCNRACVLRRLLSISSFQALPLGKWMYAKIEQLELKSRRPSSDQVNPESVEASCSRFSLNDSTCPSLRPASTDTSTGLSPIKARTLSQYSFGVSLSRLYADDGLYRRLLLFRRLYLSLQCLTIRCSRGPRLLGMNS